MPLNGMTNESVKEKTFPKRSGTTIKKIKSNIKITAMATRNLWLPFLISPDSTRMFIPKIARNDNPNRLAMCITLVRLIVFKK